jgi:hypothetical protein
MRWFEHQSTARSNKKIRKIERRYHEQGGGDAAMAAVGRYWRLLEVIADMGSKDGEGKDIFALPPDYDLALLAEDLHCSEEYLNDFLDFLAEINCIDGETWGRRTIYCPKMAERADTYTKRRKKGETSNDIQTQFEDTSNKVSPTTQTQNQTQNQEQEQDRNTPPAPPEGEEEVLKGHVKKGGKKNLRMTPQEFMDLWNDIEPISGMEPVEMLPERKRKIETRLAWKDDIEFWRTVFQKVKDSPFLRGEVETFKATLDWLTKNNTIPQNVYEGAFDDKRVKGGGPIQRPRDPDFEGLESQ